MKISPIDQRVLLGNVEMAQAASSSRLIHAISRTTLKIINLKMSNRIMPTEVEVEEEEDAVMGINILEYNATLTRDAISQIVTTSTQHRMGSRLLLRNSNKPNNIQQVECSTKVAKHFQIINKTPWFKHLL